MWAQDDLRGGGRGAKGFDQFLDGDAIPLGVQLAGFANGDPKLVLASGGAVEKTSPQALLVVTKLRCDVVFGFGQDGGPPGRYFRRR